MKKKTLDKLKTALDFPIYALSFEPVRVVVTKLTEAGKGTLRLRVDKHIIADNKCTCPAFFKSDRCKHLDMVEDTYVGSGVAKHVVLMEIERVMSILGLGDPKSLINDESLPEDVSLVKLPIPKAAKARYPIVYLATRTFGGGSFVLRLESKDN